MLMLASSLAMAACAGTGCSVQSNAVQVTAVDREQLLIGRWQGENLGAGEAAEILDKSAGRSIPDPEQATRLMAAATYVDLKPDKTFTAEMGILAVSGEFTFNRDTGEVVLTILQEKGPLPEDASRGDLSWTAYLDENNEQLLLFPVPPASAATVRQAKLPGGVPAGIKLGKTK
jgi:hypothetical protein